jgi:hypothetical protein
MEVAMDDDLDGLEFALIVIGILLAFALGPR